MLTLDDLRAICPTSKVSTLEIYVDPLGAAMEEFEINNVERETMFLAQVAHESGGFRYTSELASGEAYEDRVDLGNTKPEAIEVAQRNGSTPGRWFKGHGLIQTTGYDNHCAARDALGIDCVETPTLLCEPVNAARSAALFWKTHGLNELADEGDFVRVTRKINGGVNGLADRQAYLQRAQDALT